MKTQPFTAPALTEAQVQQQIINALSARSWMVVRFNSGAVKAGNRFVRFYNIHGLGSAGLPDVICFRADNGGGINMQAHCEALLIEVKDAKGKLTESQLRFRDFAARFGIKVHCCRSWQEVAELVEGL